MNCCTTCASKLEKTERKRSDWQTSGTAGWDVVLSRRKAAKQRSTKLWKIARDCMSVSCIPLDEYSFTSMWAQSSKVGKPNLDSVQNQLVRILVRFIKSLHNWVFSNAVRKQTEKTWEIGWSSLPARPQKPPFHLGICAAEGFTSPNRSKSTKGEDKSYVTESPCHHVAKMLGRGRLRFANKFLVF